MEVEDDTFSVTLSVNGLTNFDALPEVRWSSEATVTVSLHFYRGLAAWLITDVILWAAIFDGQTIRSLLVERKRQSSCILSTCNSMGWTCSAFGCHNRYGKDKVQFYRFPAEKKRRNSWIAAVKRDGWIPTEYSRLCSAHFITGQFNLLLICITTVE